MTAISTGEGKEQPCWSKSWPKLVWKTAGSSREEVAPDLWYLERISSWLIYTFAFASFSWFCHMALEKKGNNAFKWASGIQNQCLYVSYKIMLNRPQNENQNNWFPGDLGGTVSAWCLFWCMKESAGPFI